MCVGGGGRAKTHLRAVRPDRQSSSSAAQRASAASDAKRRRTGDTNLPQGPWTRPPDWLYLPHQGCIGVASYAMLEPGEDDGAAGAEVQRGHSRPRRSGAAVPRHTIPGRAAAEAIRGRGAAPGRAGGGPYPGRGDAGLGAGRGGTIRGHDQVPGRVVPAVTVADAASRRAAADRAREGARQEAERRGLAQYFAGIAEAAEKRARSGATSTDGDARATASERLAALRRRIALKTQSSTSHANVAAAPCGQPCEGADSGASASTTSAEVGHQTVAAAHCRKAVRRHAVGGQAERPSNEDVNIHLFNSRAGAAAGGGCGGGTPPADAARTAAARRVAWHSGAGG